MSTSTQNEPSKDYAQILENKDEQKKLGSIKHSKFTELIGWLQNWGYNVVDKSKSVKTPGIEFQAEITPQVPYSSGLSTPLYLEFQDDLSDGIILRTTYELDKNIEIHLNTQTRAREIELTYIEINQLVLPMKVSLIRDHPFIKLYKVVFTDRLDKQYFLECMIDLMNSMSLITGKWDEKYYSVPPKETIAKKEKKIDDLELEEILNG
ncbi:hypothetical protein [Candidatus Nitrosocosmicus arcticus]|uniref:Uncharacterized protein n=1 Tax=Candidatus Nitrosocosmicus arcticus TaxID=2035267 RepID=A0A557SWW0_9ARCH|nr:hypothetical protein [Candidatus Nitrosocosmicus arcticus]TVP41090.1 hypothetical protein NARC_40050 [Candidatus Nitrosocosmicus arcticus]